jgi:hypothetical protein
MNRSLLIEKSSISSFQLASTIELFQHFRIEAQNSPERDHRDAFLCSSRLARVYSELHGENRFFLMYFQRISDGTKRTRER